MALEGKLTKDKFGYSMPVDAPLFAKPPIYYKHAESITITYETDPDAAVRLLPEGLLLPEPATAILVFAKYPFSTFGPYEETILLIPCLFNDELKVYIAHIMVNSDIPQTAGREIWGYPKKLATITFHKEYDLIFAKMERPEGNTICSAGIRPETPSEDMMGGVGILGLRVIPNPEKEAPPSLAELIEIPQVGTVHESWSGPGWALFHNASDLEPWHKLKIKQILGANYRITDMELGFGRIIKRY
ncbi:MAG: acetoacetate decarboxylase family protein [Deltaproteobacteria bacterium]|nr:acetoacetate decarboxylase family protein [Deltaproteobacteria bacterium]